MSQRVPYPSRQQAWLAAAGALYAGVAVALSAYAAHAGDAGMQPRLQLAALFFFGHGVALAALAPLAQSRMGRMALWLLLVGTLLFSVSLVARALLGWPPRLAPAGGMVLIAAWLAFAIDRLRN